MQQKFVLFVLFLTNVHFLFGFRYPQYEDHPADHQEIAATHSITNYKSHPPIATLSKNTADHQFGKWLERRFNSLGNDGGLRKFQKATNSLRRNNIDKSEVECMPRKNQKEKERAKHMRRTETNSISGIDDIDLKVLDKKIQQLIRARTLQKFKQALDSVISDDYIGSEMEGESSEYAKRRINDDVSEDSHYGSSDDSSEESDEYNEGSGEDSNSKID